MDEAPTITVIAPAKDSSVLSLAGSGRHLLLAHGSRLVRIDLVTCKSKSFAFPVEDLAHLAMVEGGDESVRAFGELQPNLGGMQRNKSEQRDRRFPAVLARRMPEGL